MRIRVRSTDDLQSVIRAASPGDQLVLMPGEYAGNYVIDKPLELTGGKAEGTVTLSAEHGSCLRITEPRTIIWGLTLRAASRSTILLDIETNDVIVDESVLRGGETAVRICGNNITLNRCQI